MCEPTAIAAAASVAGTIAEQQAAEAGVKARNRAKLKNFERDNQNYLTQVMLDNAVWKNDVQIADVKFDDTYQAMIDQWREQDKQLDQLFAKHDFAVERAIREMYENDYAGTQTGNTAARLAGKSAKELGFKKAESLNEKMFAAETVQIKKESYKREADARQWDIYDQIRFQPIHGHAPPPPLLEAMPSRAGAFLNIASSVFGAIPGDSGATKVTK